ncbi:hypothetical protein JCM19037_1037 [Geomicrobium sp. JCM 19037]|nr:hypothetical protein JCM19037_1037 [Geomicrobium sp. JCM 19037]
MAGHVCDNPALKPGKFGAQRSLISGFVTVCVPAPALSYILLFDCMGRRAAEIDGNSMVRGIVSGERLSRALRCRKRALASVPDGLCMLRRARIHPGSSMALHSQDEKLEVLSCCRHRWCRRKSERVEATGVGFGAGGADMLLVFRIFLASVASIRSCSGLEGQRLGRCEELCPESAPRRTEELIYVTIRTGNNARSDSDCH